MTLCSPSMRCSACFGSEADRFSRELAAFISNVFLGCPTSIANGDGRAAPRLIECNLEPVGGILSCLSRASRQKYLATCCDRKVSSVIRSTYWGPAHGRGHCMALAPYKPGTTKSVPLLCEGRTVRFLFFKGR
jgi:hypothetical protein